MNPKIVRRPEQIKLIMECRQSGLSDYQWCRTHNINPGTFYNWVSKLKKSGYTFPESESKNSGIPIRQEVVKLELADQRGYLLLGWRGKTPSACPCPFLKRLRLRSSAAISHSAFSMVQIQQ